MPSSWNERQNFLQANAIPPDETYLGFHPAVSRLVLVGAAPIVNRIFFWLAEQQYKNGNEQPQTPCDLEIKFYAPSEKVQDQAITVLIYQQQQINSIRG